MIQKLWFKVANAGITDGLSLLERKSVGLINRVCLSAILLFLLLGLLNGLGNLETDVFNVLDILTFSATIWLNHRGKYRLSKHIFTLYGILRISSIHLLIEFEMMGQINYLSLVLIIMLIYNNRKTMLFYLALTFVAFLLVSYYQLNYPPLFNFEFTLLQQRLNALANIFINLFVVGVFTIYFFRDLTQKYDERLLENNIQLEQQKEELTITMEKLKDTQSKLVESEKLASLGEVTAGLAHEINNPINFVAGNIGPLKLDVDDLLKLIEELEKNYHGDLSKLKSDFDFEVLQEETRSLLKGMETGTKRIKEIINGLRSFSRTDENVFKAGDINTDLESTLLILSNKIKHGIQIVKNFQELPLVEANHGKLNQVFLNIINNSIYAIKEKGIITIKTIVDNDQVVIEIKDNGPGIAKGHLEKIFEPFFTTKPIGKGTGLGLSISKGIIESHNGSLNVQSIEGQFTCFSIRIPINQVYNDNNAT